MISLEYIILTKILGEKDGTLFFTEDFLSIGNAKAVSKALERLEKKEKLRRVARGIYKKPEYNSSGNSSEFVYRKCQSRE